MTEMTSMTEPEKKRTRQQTLRSASDEQQRASREASGEHLRAGSFRGAGGARGAMREPAEQRQSLCRPRRAVSRPSSAGGRMSIMSTSLTRIAQKCSLQKPGTPDFVLRFDLLSCRNAFSCAILDGTLALQKCWRVCQLQICGPMAPWLLS